VDNLEAQELLLQNIRVNQYL